MAGGADAGYAGAHDQHVDVLSSHVLDGSLASVSGDITIVEVSPRDGLQNESVLLSTDAKVELITQLVDAGARRVEAVSFAHPKLVPAMADAEAVMERVPRRHGVSYAGLVLNRRGLDRALRTGVDEVNAVVAVTDTFSRKNQNMSTEEAMRDALSVIADARSAGLFTTLTLSVVFGCPFEGEVPVERVVGLAAEAAGAGVQELALGDTIGVGVPAQVRDMTARVRDAVGPSLPLRYHFHNTRNTGFANAYAAVLDGVTVLDASAGGIGGCPFAPTATGNIATDDLVYLLERMGYRTGFDLPALLPTAAYLSEQLGHEVPALLPRAGTFPG
jgi:isopropylmalate/homocitrate/citramalate synthase